MNSRHFGKISRAWFTDTSYIHLQHKNNLSIHPSASSTLSFHLQLLHLTRTTCFRSVGTAAFTPTRKKKNLAGKKTGLTGDFASVQRCCCWWCLSSYLVFVFSPRHSTLETPEKAFISLVKIFNLGVVSFTGVFFHLILLKASTYFLIFISNFLLFHINWSTVPNEDN